MDKKKKIILTEEQVKSIFYELAKNFDFAPKFHTHKELKRYDDSEVLRRLDSHSNSINEFDSDIELIKKREKVVFTNNLIGWLLVLVSLGFIFRALMYWHIGIALFFIGIVLAIVGFSGMADTEIKKE